MKRLMPYLRRQRLLAKVVSALETRRFREYSAGWFRGWICVPSPHHYYGKMYKAVGPHKLVVKHGFEFTP